MSAEDIRAYTRPESCPKERPPIEDMSPDTKELHRSVDDCMRRHGRPYLHPGGETLQLDLLGSPNMIAWQERKAGLIFEGERCWSDLPQVYARYGTETTRRLLHRVLEWEDARAAILTDCGMQACALLFDVLMRPKSHAVVPRAIYNKTKKYLERLSGQIGAVFTIIDNADRDAVEKAVREETSMVFVETFTNPLMRAVDPARLGELAARCRREGARGLRLVIDSTIATPWALKKPLLHCEGVDFVVASGTKALGGADRDLWGYVASNRVDTLNELMDLQAMRGGILDWRRARAVLDGLDDARSRYEKRCATAARVASFLDAHPKTSEVFHPSLADHPDRAVVDRFYRFPGSLLSFRIAGADEDATRYFCDVLATTVVPRYALSFDGLTTKLNHHLTVSEYFTPVEEIQRAGIDRLVRLGVGLEDPDDIIACLNWALWHFREVDPEELERWREERARDLGIYEHGEGA